MSMVGNFAKVLAPAALLLASNSFAQALVPSGPVVIKRISANGTGCPAGTVSTNISDDKQAFTLTFSEFVAEAGPGLASSVGRKNCILTATLGVPVGWQYSVGSFFYRGFMGLDLGIRATHSTSYFFAGVGRQGTFQSTKDGAYSSDYVFSDKVGLASVNWSDCNAERDLNINTSIRVSNTNPALYPNAQGLITNDSIDGEIKQVFGLTWRRCPGVPAPAADSAVMRTL